MQQENMQKAKLFANNLQIWRKKNRMSKGSLAELVGYSLRTIDNYEDGNHKLPGIRKIRNIAEKMNLEVAWLLEDHQNQQAVLPKGPTPMNHGGPYYGTTNEAPVVSWAQAGSDWHDFQDLCNQIDERIPTDCKDTNCFWIRTEGDSMEPLYKSGDYVIVMPNVEAQNGDLVIAKTVDDGVYFKLYHKSVDGLRVKLASYNTLYPVMEFELTQIARLFPVYGVFRRTKSAGKRN